MGVYTGIDDFTESPERFFGDAIVMGGFVQQVSPLVIKVETTYGTHGVTITDSELRPEVRDRVRVFGTLTDPRTIRSHHAFVVPQGGLWYTWSVSFLAGLWVLGRLIQWTIDVSRLRFQRRDSSLSPRAPHRMAIPGR